MAAGRRALRRRTIVTSAAGTAGVAAVTAAVVVPVVAIGSNGAQRPSQISVRTTPTSTPCHTAYFLSRSGSRANKADLRHEFKRLHRKTTGPIYEFHPAGRHNVIGLSTCPKSARGQATPAPSPTTPPAPRYHYTEPASHISTRLGAHLADRLRAWRFTIVYSRPFAQETSQLAKGHPRYYGGNDDVRVKGELADVGVQVTHAVTTQVAFTGSCTPPRCVQSTLPDGSVERISQIHAGSGGATVISAEIHHPDGLVVAAQQANYGFGPQATTARSVRQPLTMEQLKALAADPAFSF